MSKKFGAILLAVVLMMSLVACQNDETEDGNDSDTTNTYTELVTETSVEDLFSERDLDSSYDESEVVDLVLSDDTVTITEQGVYFVTGSISDGQIIIDVADDEKVQLVLSNVSINSNDSAPIYVVNADKVFITLLEGTTNTLSINSDISDNTEGIDGVIYSTSDLTLNGTGSLIINSDYTHGIVCKDDLKITNGTYTISVGNDGLQANDSIRVINATLDIDSSNDGIQVSNEDPLKGYVYLENSAVTLTTDEDGINATSYVLIISGTYVIDSEMDGISSDTDIQIDGGTFNITTGGGFDEVLNIITVGEGSSGVVSETDKLSTSMKGIKADNITINDGVFTISSYEDALNADTNITINDGELTINSGDEAITGQNIVEINGGVITIENGYEGIEGGYITFNGGTISINVLDDGVNGNESYSVVTINGGTIYVSCSGDGLDSNGDLIINDGYITLDVDAIYVGGDGNIDAGTVTYNGGTIVDENGNEIDPTEELEEGGGMLPPRR